MHRFIPIYNYSSKWYLHNNVWAKGFAYDDNNRLLTGEMLAKLFAAAGNTEALVSISKKLKGQFSIMGISGSLGFAITDRIRSFPLFFTRVGEFYSVSDSPYCIAQSTDIDEISYACFKSSGYCIGDKTLLKDVKQVEAGSIVIYDGAEQNSFSTYSHSTSLVSDSDFGSAKGELRGILDRIMGRMIESLTGKTIAIPLSGGYDSRFILSWLIMNGYPNIKTFTYGRSGSLEIEFAKRVTDKLSIDWIPIRYNHEMMKGITNDGFFKEYIQFSSLACSMPFFQDYPAMRYLRTNGILPTDSVVVPGHSGDVLAGSHLFPSHQNLKITEVYDTILSIHHGLLPAFRNEISSIREVIKPFVQNSRGKIPYTILEDWDLHERQAKFIVNSTRTYQFFGYDLRLPFFDNEFVEFFRHVPFEYKLAKRLYRETLEDYYFKPLGLHFEDEMQATLNELKLQQYKDFLKLKIPFLKKFVRKPADNNCYTEIAFQLFTETGIKQEISIGSKNTNAPIVEWYLKYFQLKIGDWLLQENKI